VFKNNISDDDVDDDDNDDDDSNNKAVTSEVVLLFPTFRPLPYTPWHLIPNYSINKQIIK